MRFGGPPLGILSFFCICFSGSALISAAVVLPLLSMRKIQTIVEGRRQLPSYELKGLGSLIVTTCCLGIPNSVVVLMHGNGLVEPSTFWATVSWFYGFWAIVCFSSSGAGLIFLRRLRGSAIHTLVKQYTNLFFVGLCGGLFFIHRSVGLRERGDTENALC